MKNIRLATIYKLLFIGFLGISLVNCEGEDGAAGPDGLDGVNGSDGSNGTDGINGQDGVGFEELTQFGSIDLTLNGNRADTGEAFTDTKKLEFTAIDAISLINFNSFTTNDTGITFNLLRFLNTPDENSQEFTAGIILNVINPGTDTQEFEFTLDLNEYNIVFEDLVLLQLNELFDNQDIETPLSNFSITNFNFNDDTNNLTFSFSFDIDGANNGSENDLSISGEVDVIVLENIPGVDIL
ncbi:MULTISPECIES: collagen-like protein [Aquimarina]|uniref:collagen-like protein n=1 Tax=Aquimarina TaxID=290174 RepID=UPI000D68F12F|nr:MULTISPECIES: collagen-like protein [Aquimarina]